MTTPRRHGPIRLPTISWIMSVLGGVLRIKFKIIFYLFSIKNLIKTLQILYKYVNINDMETNL